MAQEEITLVDAHADIEGKLKGRDIRILGRLRGEITAAGRLVLGQGCKVEAKVVAEAAEVAGELKGDLRARVVTLAETAQVEGKVDAHKLVVREGARLNGAVNAGEAATGPAAAKLAAQAAAIPLPPPTDKETPRA